MNNKEMIKNQKMVRLPLETVIQRVCIRSMDDEILVDYKKIFEIYSQKIQKYN